ncbi:MAG: hypothetical protein JNM83_24100 [Myxococcales bacterium]|nr:hypothetical protein [Myxococcales bacterium]
MSFRKSATCVGKASGQPVTEYDSEYEAHDGAAHARLASGQDLVPYLCGRCRLWHLAPRSRQTPSTTCGHCTGADGKPKEAYATERDAERRAEILRAERGVHLRAYPCHYGQGWHLTKS